MMFKNIWHPRGHIFYTKECETTLLGNLRILCHAQLTKSNFDNVIYIHLRSNYRRIVKFA